MEDRIEGRHEELSERKKLILKAIIDAHKEEIWVHSEYGKNCEFGFTISAKPVHPKGNEREWLS